MEKDCINEDMSESEKRMIRLAKQTVRRLMAAFYPYLYVASMLEFFYKAIIAHSVECIRENQPEGRISIAQIALHSGLDKATVRRALPEARKRMEGRTDLA